jgi:cytochrome P450
MAFLLLIAGHSTTAAMIASATLKLMRQPHLLAALRDDPGQIPAAVEELIRQDSPVQVTTERFAIATTTIGDVQIARGDMVIVALNSANRDAARFSRPDELDLSRDTSGHLGWGFGIHRCLGAPLARLEAQIALRALIEVIPNVEFEQLDTTIQWLHGLLVHGPAHLPVRYRSPEPAPLRG